MTIIRSDSDHPDFKKLANELELDLKIRDGIHHSLYASFNRIDKLHHVVIVYDKEIPIGCGGFRSFTADRMEIKRMYVRPAYRRLGIAGKLLTELEKWSKETGAAFCVLETGKNQPEAIALYEKNNFQRIPKFGPYKESPNSVCLEKSISA